MLPSGEYNGLDTAAVCIIMQSSMVANPDPDCELWSRLPLASIYLAPEPRHTPTKNTWKSVHKFPRNGRTNRQTDRQTNDQSRKHNRRLRRRYKPKKKRNSKAYRRLGRWRRLQAAVSCRGPSSVHQRTASNRAGDEMRWNAYCGTDCKWPGAADRGAEQLTTRYMPADRLR